MSKCVNCSNKQSKLNRGKFCQVCFNDINCVNKNNSTFEHKNTDEVINETSFNDRQIIDMIKENMIQEKKSNEERTQLLVDQIEFLKSEILVKNTFIERLIVKLSSKKGTTSNSDCSSLPSFENTMNDSHANVLTPSICNDIYI